METYDIVEIKSRMEGMSLREKIEYLRDIHGNIVNEIEDLESVESEVEELLDDAETQINKKYNDEIGAALNDVIAAHPGEACTILPENTLDIEGLRFCFIGCSGEGLYQLYIGISGRKPIIRIVDFNAEFGDIVKQMFQVAKYRNKSLVFNLATEADAIPLVKEIAEKLLSIAPKIAEMAVRHGFV